MANPILYFTAVQYATQIWNVHDLQSLLTSKTKTDSKASTPANYTSIIIGLETFCQFILVQIHPSQRRLISKYRPHILIVHCQLAMYESVEPENVRFDIGRLVIQTWKGNVWKHVSGKDWLLYQGLWFIHLFTSMGVDVYGVTHFVDIDGHGDMR